jgi:8-oxo-dGTP pyrophosphatase MutT (NUDIX family)
MPTIPEIIRLLAHRKPALLCPENGSAAAVAMILRQGPTGAEILFIIRARRNGDPWSGDLGFPGGKIEPGDAGPRPAAERETLEEIGLDLDDAHCLGRLDDIAGAHLPVRVSCFVFLLERTDPFVFSEEIADAFWFPLADLLDPKRHVQEVVHFKGERLSCPAVRVLGEGETVLWGITYRLICQFLQILGHPIHRDGK